MLPDIFKAIAKRHKSSKKVIVVWEGSAFSTRQLGRTFLEDPSGMDRPLGFIFTLDSLEWYAETAWGPLRSKTKDMGKLIRKLRKLNGRKPPKPLTEKDPPPIKFKRTGNSLYTAYVPVDHKWYDLLEVWIYPHENENGVRVGWNFQIHMFNQGTLFSRDEMSGDYPADTKAEAVHWALKRIAEEYVRTSKGDLRGVDIILPRGPGS